MLKEKIEKISKKFSGSMLYRTVCILLLLTMITAWSVTGVYAKYVSSSTTNETAKVASMGVFKFEVSEHEPIIDIDYMIKNNALHGLHDTNTVTNYTDYSDVPPGVDIPKDISVRMHLEAEVNYELYVRVTKSDKFPSTVTFEMADGWTQVEGDETLYKYNVVFKATEKYGSETKDYVVGILKDDKLIVSDQYKGGSFGIEFVAYLKQSKKAQ